MHSRESTLPSRLTTWVNNWVASKKVASLVDISLLAGDGSVRSFYRIRTKEKNYILLSDPEWILSKDYATHQEYLASRQIPVPVFFSVDPESGFLVMEDLGDELLQFRLLAEPNKKMGWLEKASALLANLHRNTFPVPSDLPAALRKFDTAKYSEELFFTFEHLHQSLLELPPIEPTQRNKVIAFAQSLDSIRPYVFAHRDYQSRNILLHHEQLFLIDFQDARLGPPHYDLASLIYDPYIPHTDSETNHLVEIYRRAVEGSPLEKAVDWKRFPADLARIGFQRVVKAAGSYASFFTRNGKRTHLPYLVPALHTAIELRDKAGLSPELVDVFPLRKWLEEAGKLKS